MISPFLCYVPSFNPTRDFVIPTFPLLYLNHMNPSDYLVENAAKRDQQKERKEQQRSTNTARPGEFFNIKGFSMGNQLSFSSVTGVRNVLSDDELPTYLFEDPATESDITKLFENISDEPHLELSPVPTRSRGDSPVKQFASDNSFEWPIHFNDLIGGSHSNEEGKIFITHNYLICHPKNTSEGKTTAVMVGHIYGKQNVQVYSHDHKNSLLYRHYTDALEMDTVDYAAYGTACQMLSSLRQAPEPRAQSPFTLFANVECIDMCRTSTPYEENAWRYRAKGASESDENEDKEESEHEETDNHDDTFDSFSTSALDDSEEFTTAPSNSTHDLRENSEGAAHIKTIFSKLGVSIWEEVNEKAEGVKEEKRDEEKEVHPMLQCLFRK